jgi:opacity protein-like surface antigen
MKKLLLSLIAIFAFTFANAQEETVGFSKNDLFVTGSFSYADSSKDFNFGAAANVFVTPNISVGGEYVRTQNGEFKTNDIAVNGRNYFTPANQFSLFGELRVATNVDSDSGSNFNIQVNPGINYFISNNFSLETKVGFIGYDTETSDFTFGTNLMNVALGLNYRF